MTHRPRSPAARLLAAGGAPSALLALLLAAVPAAAVNYPVTAEQRERAQQVAQAGVPLSELSPNAPDSHTVKPGDTLWDISKLFLKSPWRWPELWGMNLQQIRNPHLISPGQLLVLDRSGGRARLRLAQQVDGAGGGTVKLSPRVRTEPLAGGAIAALPLHLIAPFLDEAVVFDGNDLATAPRIVAAPEGRVLLTRGDTAYVRGDLGGGRDFRVFREARPLRDPATKEVLGYEARYLGTAEAVRPEGTASGSDGKPVAVPATAIINAVRSEIGVGDRLAPLPVRSFDSYAPHPPAQPVAGQIVSIYGDALTAGQNQIVALNRGERDGLERGHVLALWRDGAMATDRTEPGRPRIKLPDERHGTLFVFSVFPRVSYALIMSVQQPVSPGDRFTQP